MPVKELQLETGGSADLLIQETGDSNDAILLEDSTSPTTQTVGMRASVSGSEARVRILGAGAKTSGITKGKEDRGTVLSRQGIGSSAERGKGSAVRIVVGRHSGRSMVVGIDYGAMKKTGTAKSVDECVGVKSSAMKKATAFKCIDESLGAKRTTVYVFMRAAACLIGSGSGRPATRCAASFVVRDVLTFKTHPTRIYTYTVKMRASVSGSTTAGNIRSKQVSGFSQSKAGFARCVISTAAAMGRATWKLATNSSVRLCAISSGVAKVFSVSTQRTFCSGTAKGSSKLFGWSDRMLIAARLFKDHAESMIAARSMMICCGKLTSRDVFLGREVSCSIAGSSAKGAASARGAFFARDVRARTLSAMSRGSQKGISAVLIAPKMACVDEFLVCGRSGARATAIAKTKATTGWASVSSIVMATTGKTTSKPSGGKFPAARKTAVSWALGESKGATPRTGIKCGLLQARAAGKAAAGITTFMVATARSADWMLMAGRSASRASATARARALSGFKSLCSKRITVSFVEESRVGWFVDVGKPVPEVYVYLLGQIDPDATIKGLMATTFTASLAIEANPGVVGCLTSPAAVEGYLSWLAMLGDLSDSIEVKGEIDDDSPIESAMVYERADVTEIRSGTFGASSAVGGRIDMVLV